MIVLEHTNPPTIYLDYHYWLPERGASGIMIGGEYYRYSDSGAFITCNPSPGGELGLGSPLTKNKSTFSDYHYWNTSSWLLISAGVNGASGIFSTLLGGYESIPEICSRLSKN